MKSNIKKLLSVLIVALMLISGLNFFPDNGLYYLSGHDVYAASTTYIQNVDDNGDGIAEMPYQYIKFTSSDTWTVPAGVTSIDVFLVGGGGGGDMAGGAGGYTKTYKRQSTGYKDGGAISVTPGSNVSITVGSGGTAGYDSKNKKATDGGYSQIISSSYRADGGGAANGNYGTETIGEHTYPYKGQIGGNGGSGGANLNRYKSLGWAGSDGGDRRDFDNGDFGDIRDDGQGQGHTTKEFGESTGTLYAGGGGSGGLQDESEAGTHEDDYWGGGDGGGGDCSLYCGIAGTDGLGSGGGGRSIYSRSGKPNTGGNGGSGIVIVRYPANTKPAMSIASPAQNEIYSETDIIVPTIYVSDQENDTLTCKYYVDSDTIPRDTKTVMNTSSQKTVTFSSLSINTLSEGTHTLKFEVSDGITQTSQLTVNIIIDKTPPALSTVTVTSTTTSVTVGGSASDSIAGLDANPYRYTVGSSASSWGTGTSYTKSSLEPNTQYLVRFEARDKKGHIANNTGNIYTKAQTPSITVSNASSYTLDLITSDSNAPNTLYQISTETEEGALTTSPIWVTFVNKKITITGLSPSTTYTFRVKAKNGEGIETGLSSPASGTTLAVPPGSPANITATATHTSITVIWDAVAGAVSYDIEVDGNIVNNGTNTSYTHNNLAPGTPHTYRIRANNAGGNGNWSAPITKSTSPDSPYIPLNISTAATDTKVILTWDAVAGATGYDIEVDSSVVNNGSSTNYVHAGLLPGTTHSYRVRSINAGGKSEWSSEVLVTTQMDTPQTPSNIETTEGKTQIALTWDAIAGATGYDIEVDGFIADNGTRTTYTHSNLAPGTQHTYRVRSKKQGIVSDWSALLTASTLEDIFGKPTNFKAAATDTTVTLTWDPVYTATGYEVEADGIITDNGMDTVCVFGNLAPESHHTYRVRARNGEVASEWSEYQAVETFALPTPSDFYVTSTETTVTAVWDAVYEADYYDLEMDGTVTGDVYGTTFTYEGLSPNTQHILRVRAENQRGISAWSLPFYIATLSTQDHSQLSIITKSRNTSITVIWGNIEEATGYDIQKDGQTIENIPDVSYLDDNLEPGTQHAYRVRVRNGTEIGEWSGEITASTLPSGPVTPTNIIASATASSILVTWDAVENAAEYEIEVDGQIINAGSGTSYLRSGLSSESQHTYRVRSKNISETSPWSDLLTVTTKSSTQTFTLNCTAGEVFNLLLTASNVENLSQQIFTVTYNPDELEVVDLCGSTPRLDTNPGNIIGTDIQIIQYQPGTIMFAKIGSTSPGQIWSGTVNTVKFKSKIDGQLNITFTSH